MAFKDNIVLFIHWTNPTLPIFSINDMNKFNCYQYQIVLRIYTWNNLINTNNEAIRPPLQAMSRQGKKLSLVLSYYDYVTESLKKIRESTINERSIIFSH